MRPSSIALNPEAVAAWGTLGVHQVAFNPHGERIATASADRTIKLWDAATGQELLTLGGHNAGVICLAFSPDGHRLASGSIDWTARIWDGREWH